MIIGLSLVWYVISLQGQRRIRSPTVYSASAVTLRTGARGCHSRMTAATMAMVRMFLIRSVGDRSGHRPIRHAQSGGDRSRLHPSGHHARNPGSGHRTGGQTESGRIGIESWVVSFRCDQSTGSGDRIAAPGGQFRDRPSRRPSHRNRWQDRSMPRRHP